MPSPPADFFRALRRREALRADRETDAWRLIDGADDGAAFEGLYLDDFAGRWLVQTTRPEQKPPEWLLDRVDPGGADQERARAIYWKRLDSRGEHQRPPTHWAGEEVSAPFEVREHGLRFLIEFEGGYSQGLFLDQRENRARVRRRAAPGMVILNCFAYTCAFSVAAAVAGARTVSVDLSKRSLERGRDNLRLNIRDEGTHEFYAGDVFEHLRRFGRQQRRFGGIILDPPTFSRDRKGRVFRAADDFGTLVRLAVPLLESGGYLLCSVNAQNYTAERFRTMLRGTLDDFKDRAWQLEAVPPPADFSPRHALQAVWCVDRELPKN